MHFGVVNKLWKLTFISHVMELFSTILNTHFLGHRPYKNWCQAGFGSGATVYQLVMNQKQIGEKILRFPRAHAKLALQSLPHPVPTANSRLCHHTRDESRVSRTLYLAMLPTLRNLVCLLPHFNLWDKSFTVTDWSGTHLCELRVHRACLYLSNAGSLVCFSLCILGTESVVFPWQAKCSTIKLYPWYLPLNYNTGTLVFWDWVS